MPTVRRSSNFGPSASSLEPFGQLLFYQPKSCSLRISVLKKHKILSATKIHKTWNPNRKSGEKSGSQSKNHAPKLLNGFSLRTVTFCDTHSIVTNCHEIVTWVQLQSWCGNWPFKTDVKCLYLTKWGQIILFIRHMMYFLLIHVSLCC